MLYITTRSHCESYTASRTLGCDHAPDGARFVPMRLPNFSQQDIRRFEANAFGQTVADILNLFFRIKLSCGDVEQCLQSCGIRFRNIDRKVTVAELWNKNVGSFADVQYALYHRLCQNVSPKSSVSAWAKIAISAAFLFGLYCQMENEGREVDIALNSGDFSLPMAAYYCRKMGLPIGKIICVTNENSALWDFFTHGSLNCGINKLLTALPEADVACPSELEMLIFDVFGLAAATEFGNACELGKLFSCTEKELTALTEGFSVSVVGAQRVDSVIHRIFHTGKYVLDPYTALCYGGLQDYRANSGESRPTLLLSEDCSLNYRGIVAKALGISDYKLPELI